MSYTPSKPLTAPSIALATALVLDTERLIYRYPVKLFLNQSLSTMGVMSDQAAPPEWLRSQY
jgi:hypothetical protein